MTTSELFRLERVPVLQNRMYDSEAEGRECPMGDVVLVQDLETGLIHNAAFDSAVLVYDERYQNEQAVSPAFVRHLDEVLQLVGRWFRGRSIVEIGCGKGYFLERLLNAGYSVLGVDPAYEGDNPHIFKDRFGAVSDLRAECIVLRHVLEHMEQPLEFLAEVARANGGCGRVYIEVPCFDWICQRRAWFDVFYEHVNYFRLEDLYGMFGRVYEAGRLFGGQYLYVFAEISTLRQPQLAPGGAFRVPEDLFAGVSAFAALARAGAGRCAAIWGAGAKGVMFAHHLTRLGVPFACLIDVNPAKQGKYVAGSGLKVLSPEEAAKALSPGDRIFVMNSNYFDEIEGALGGRYQLTAIDRS